LSGEPRTLGAWADLVLRPLGLLAFSLDRPLVPERVYTVWRDSLVIDGEEEIAERLFAASQSHYLVRG
jgi:hypothetical protein